MGVCEKGSGFRIKRGGGLEELEGFMEIALGLGGLNSGRYRTF